MIGRTLSRFETVEVHGNRDTGRRVCVGTGVGGDRQVAGSAVLALG